MSNCAIFVDFDNIFTTLWDLDRDAAIEFASEPAAWLQGLANTHLTAEPRRWLLARCYLNPAGFVPSPGVNGDRLFFSKFRPSWVRSGFEVVDCPVLARGGKNAADIRMVIDSLDLLHHRTHFDEFVIASGDPDFTPLLQRLRAHDRRITIVSPGHLSSAYTSIADKIVGYEAIIHLLEDEAEDLAGAEAQADFEKPEILDEEAREFAAFIQTQYAEAAARLNLSNLGAIAASRCPSAKRTNWFGTGSFVKAVKSLDLPKVRFSQHYMWDDERHQPPVPMPKLVGALMPPVVDQLVRELDLPRIDRSVWPRVFETLSRYSRRGEFKLTEASRWCRDELADEGVIIGRSAITYIVRGCHLGGIRLVPEVSPNPDEIRSAFLSSIIDRASNIGMPFDLDTETAIGHWFGIDNIAISKTRLNEKIDI